MTVSLFCSPCCTPPDACSFFVLLLKCCEADAEGSALKCCNVMGWACSVFELCVCIGSASGPTGENLQKTLLPVVTFALPYLSLYEKHCTSFLFPHIYSQFSPFRLHADMQVLSDQVMLSFRIVCRLVFYPRDPVSVQACASPSDFWLCFNTWNTLLWSFIGLNQFWIHLYHKTIYCIKEKSTEKDEKMFIICCWLLC